MRRTHQKPGLSTPAPSSVVISRVQACPEINSIESHLSVGSLPRQMYVRPGLEPPHTETPNGSDRSTGPRADWHSPGILARRSFRVMRCRAYSGLKCRVLSAPLCCSGPVVRAWVRGRIRGVAPRPAEGSLWHHEALGTKARGLVFARRSSRMIAPRCGLPRGFNGQLGRVMFNGLTFRHGRGDPITMRAGEHRTRPEIRPERRHCTAGGPPL